MVDRVKNLTKKVLSDNWYTLNEYTYQYCNRAGEWQTQRREAYDRGNGATILLYNRASRSVILTRQFRLPTYISGNADGLMIEACAGLLEQHNARDCIIKETEEETGYKIEDPRQIFEVFMSPGAVTEKITFFIAEYSAQHKISDGGGVASEQEDIEVLEMNFDEAYAMIGSGRIQDAKTILLLQYARLHDLL